MADDHQGCFVMDNKFPVRRIGGLPMTVASRVEAAENFVKQAMMRKGRVTRPFYSTSANGQVLSMCDKDPNVKAEFLKSDEIVADGMPLVFISRFGRGLSLPERIATTDFVHDVAKKAAEGGLTFYLFGGSEEVNRLASENMKTLYPKLNIIGRRNGYFSREDESTVVDEINNMAPDFLWIGMGVPLEQKFISRNIHRFTNVGVIKTSGGLFDFLSGKNSRAPSWMQAAGLEWAYRVALEPRRLGMRYLTTNPYALRLLVMNTDFS